MLLKNRKVQINAVAAVLLPLLFYPIFFMQVFGADTLLGDGLILHQYQHVSRRELLMLILSDWRDSLSVSYAVVAVFTAFVYGCHMVKQSSSPGCFAVLGCISGGLMSLVFFKGFNYLILFFCMTGTLLALVYCVLSQTSKMINHYAFKK